MSFRALFALFFAVVTALLSAPAATATTVVEMSDEDLAVSARAIVEGTVRSQVARFDPDRGAVFTYLTVEVDRLHKGHLLADRITLKQPGGADGAHVTIVHGAPAFADGERVLLFLTSDADGAPRVAHLCLGDFRLVVDPTSGRELAVRPGTEARLVKGASGPVTAAAPKEELLARVQEALDRRWAESVRLEAERYPEPLLAAPLDLEPQAKTSSTSNFTFLGQGFRWFQPDTRNVVYFLVNERRAPTGSGGVAEARAAFAAWSGVDRSDLELSYMGPTSKCGLRADGDNVISFGDCDRVLDDPVNCSGVVAIGGVTNAGGGAIVIGGRQFVRSNEGDVVFNNGFDCLIADPAALGEVLTHELGHVLGLGHSSENQGEPNNVLRDATMYFVTHKDGRGATIRQDDADGIRFVYGSSRGSSAPAITTTAVPDAVPGQAYRFRLRGDGRGDLSWSVASGSLPEGFSLSADGQIEGTTPTARTSSFTVQIRDASGAGATRTISLRVTASPTPYVSSATFSAIDRRLTLTGLNFGAGATVRVNGVGVARPIKYKAKKGKLTVSATAEQLGLRSTSLNTVTVTVAGRQSAQAAF